MARRRQRRREKQLFACRHCGRSFEGRANALHCSERCRQSAWRTKLARELQAGREALAAVALLKRPEELEAIAEKATEDEALREEVSQGDTDFEVWARQVRAFGLEDLT